MQTTIVVLAACLAAVRPPGLPAASERYEPERYTQRVFELSTNGGPFVPQIWWVPIDRMENTDWHQSGGTRGLKDVVSEKYRTNTAPHAVRPISVKNDLGGRQDALAITREYPVGTRFDDVLKHKGRIFEHRVREKRESGWVSKVLYSDEAARPPGYTGLTQTCASCHDRAGEGVYGKDGLVPGGDTVFSDPIDWDVLKKRR